METAGPLQLPVGQDGSTTLVFHVKYQRSSGLQTWACQRGCCVSLRPKNSLTGVGVHSVARWDRTVTPGKKKKRDRAVKMHAGCNEREIKDFSTSPNSICHSCAQAPRLQHSAVHRGAEWVCGLIGTCLPTLPFPYASSDARSIKRFCSLRYC